VLWAKSDASGAPNLLLQHLLDTAAAGELIWEEFLASTVRRRVDSICDDRGRDLLALLCGLHDVGKASPAFQSKAPELAVRVVDSGLAWRTLDRRSQQWHHSFAGAVVLKRALSKAGWDRAAVNWFWPLVAGHHGRIPSAGVLLQVPGRGNAQGTGLWEAAQDEVVARVAQALGLELADAAPTRAPRRAEQLTMAGAVIMADWIASDEHHFPGVDAFGDVSMQSARERAEAAWRSLRLRGGWSSGLLAPGTDLLSARFHVPARPSQVDAVALAEGMAAPGLLIVEAPTGEGKTESALAAVEVLARRFGADGVFVGMPTQATSDPMFSKVRRWAGEIEPGLPVGLLHGKRRFNREWHELLRHVDFDGADEFGCDDHYGLASGQSPDVAGGLPSEWFLGRKRGLLTPLTVGTIDQLLHAATRTRHVMLRYAGLAGSVVVLDEVHAYDVYMSQFLFEALRWLADAGVPVIVLSATLPPQMRRDLARAYLQGALQRRDIDLEALPSADGYPNALSVCVCDGGPRFMQRSSESWRGSLRVQVEVLEEPCDGSPEPVLAVVAEALREGGIALVVRNTVARAQQTYAALRRVFGADVVLLHARLTAGERADRTEQVLAALGPSGGQPRPARLVVVATQLAEQSFDIDADLLVTDLAPIDLLLQRVGRLHRHQRPEADRPARVRLPRLIVTGVSIVTDIPPTFPRGSSRVYGDYLLFRASALVREAIAGGGWSIPADVPQLVDRGYGDERIGPSAWSDAMEVAHEEWNQREANRRASAEPFLLSGPDNLGKLTLEGLHERSVADLGDDDKVAAVVRDGDMSVEVILVRRNERGYLTLGGRSLGVHGEAVSDEAVLDEVVQATVRLPASRGLTEAAIAELRPLPGWRLDDPWLRHARALVLDDDMTACLGGRRLTYDVELGLIDQREGGR
jgi:CRISPR-associated endonuclease/helicase Cas3